MSNFPRVFFIILDHWIEKSILAFITLAVIFLIASIHLELVFSSRFIYSFFYSLIILSILVMSCTSFIVFHFSMNIQILLPYFRDYGNFPPKKKIIRETKMPAWQVFVLLKTHQDIVRLVNRWSNQ